MAPRFWVMNVTDCSNQAICFITIHKFFVDKKYKLVEENTEIFSRLNSSHCDIFLFEFFILIDAIRERTEHRNI
jgi:hypothetical protein